MQLEREREEKLRRWEEEREREEKLRRWEEEREREEKLRRWEEERERELELERGRETERAREAERARSQREKELQRGRKDWGDEGARLGAGQDFYGDPGITAGTFPNRDASHPLQHHPQAFYRDQTQNQAARSAFHPVSAPLQPPEGRQSPPRGRAATETYPTRQQEMSRLNRKYSLTERDDPGMETGARACRGRSSAPPAPAAGPVGTQATRRLQRRPKRTRFCSSAGRPLAPGAGHVRKRPPLRRQPPLVPVRRRLDAERGGGRSRRRRGGRGRQRRSSRQEEDAASSEATPTKVGAVPPQEGVSPRPLSLLFRCSSLHPSLLFIPPPA
ncbi:hypothetical protein fugu_001862 [Takifugu bimaculatus]|uniref:Uncharacterized protein n=1 Tax=Takifugu bimaculatus TaxID=433685 RepID=A0A4Z2BQ30_9TELE|nr:hypothetical protein fugu_001862 [Takifugu bimaculatus]